MASDHLEDIYPLSPLQQGILFHTLHDPASPAYFEQSSCRFQGPVDVPVFECAWQRLVDRHAVLRTAFVWERVADPVQVVRRRVPLPLAREDWRGVAEVEQQSQLEEYLATDRKKGFKLSQAPLMRLALIRLAEQSYQFVWSYHHLLLDGWSAALLLGEFSEFYSVLIRGEEPHPEPTRPYRDFIAWLHRQDQAAARAYWQRALGDFSSPTPLPADRAREFPGEHAATGEEQQVWLSSDTTTALQRFAQQQSLTLNTLVQATWARLLSHHSGEQDVVFGVTVSGRPANIPGVETMVGLFINTLPMRVRISPAERVRPWLRGLQKQQREMQEYQYSSLVQVRDWSGVPRRQPLFESILVFESYPRANRSAGRDGGFEVLHSRWFERTNYALSAVVMPCPQLGLLIAYDRGRFQAATIQRLLDQWQTLLSSIIAGPDRRLIDITLPADEARRQVEVWNAAPVRRPTDGVHRLFEAQAGRTPEATAAVFGDSRMSYGQLDRRANQLAHGLRAIGVGPEVAVGICLDQSLDMAVALLGVLKAGGAYVPLNPELPPNRLRFLLSDARARAVLTQTRWRHQFPEYGTSLLCMDESDERIHSPCATATDAPVVGANAAYILYTSGSTGSPKGVVIPHEALANHALAVAKAYSLTEVDRVLQFASLSFDVAAEELYPSWLSGSTVILRSGHAVTSFPRFLQDLERERVTVLNIPASFWHEWVRHLALSRVPLPAALRLVIVGSEVVSAEALGCWQQLATRDIRLYNAYGLTETTITATLFEVSGRCTDPVPIGRPIANVTTYVLNQHMQFVPPGVPGDLYIGGMGLARGYLIRPELTADRFVPDPFAAEPGARLCRTGDRALYSPDGNLLFLGRTDSQVKLRSFRIELGEIEFVLRQHPAVRDAAVVHHGAEEGRADGLLAAFVVSHEPGRLTVPEIRDYVREKLPDYMVPSSYELLDALPRTPGAKVDRWALARRRGDERQPAPAHVPGRTFLEKVLAEIWADVLGVECVGIEDNFFDLGGQSLLAIRLVSRLRSVFQIELPLRSVFDRPTVGAQAREIAQARAGGSEAPPPLLQPRTRGPHVPLAKDQYQVWELNRRLPSTSFFNLTEALRLDGALDIEALVRALSEITRRHESLRTTFPAVDGRPVQRVNAPGRFGLAVVEAPLLSDGEREPWLSRAVYAEAYRPFDLTIEPPFRASLVVLGARDNVFLFTMHHIMGDGWSMDVFARELGVLYDAFAAGGRGPLRELTVQYADYALWQDEWLSGSAKDTQLAYWRRKLAGLARMDLGGRGNTARPSFRFSRRSVRLSSEATAKIEAVSRHEGSTVFIFLLAALHVVLHMYTDSEDIGVATQFANRNGVGTEEMIGLFVNTLILRIAVSGSLTYRDVLQRVRQEAIDGYSHQDIPFDYLIGTVGAVSSETDVPCAQVLFLFEASSEPLRLRGLTCTRLPVEPKSKDIVLTTYDLIVTAERTSEGLTFAFVYNRDRCCDKRIDQIASDFVAILGGMPEHLHRRVRQLPLRTAAPGQSDV